MADFDISDDEQEGHVKKRRLEDVDNYEVNSDLGSDFEDEEITSEEDDELPPLPPTRSKRAAPLPPKRGARGARGAELAGFAVVEGDDDDDDLDDEPAPPPRQRYAGSDDDDDDDDDDEEGAGAGELDNGQHAQMLLKIGLKGRQGAPRVRSEQLPEGDFSVGPRGARGGGDGDGGLTVAKLLASVGGSAEFGALKSKLGAAARSAAKLEVAAPVERTDRRRAERAAAAVVVDGELTKWTGAVKWTVAVKV
ncbi:hypothetical protein T492DRAFT_853005 [Pavlovales sp. CCMP2436]|nr:hypothetical protein T492DRAFT_853005 [Pavlovales sp. CCMP2436]